MSDTSITRETAVTLLREAVEYERRGELVRARRLYRKIADLDELAITALIQCARIDRRLGALRSAARTLTAALHHCVDDKRQSLRLYMELGDVHAELGDFEEASYHYRRALCYEPRRVDVQMRLRGALRLRYQPKPASA